MTEYVDQRAEQSDDAEETGSVLDLQRLDQDEPDVQAHASPLCLEV